MPVRLYQCQLMEDLKQQLEGIPNDTGVYMFFKDDTLLYVGKSIHMRQRIREHIYAAQQSGREHRMMTSVNRIEYQCCPGELSALLLESQEIKRLQPLYNRRLKRGRSLLTWAIRDANKPKLELLQLSWPILFDAHFGLYTNRHSAREALQSLTRQYGLCMKTLGHDTPGKGPCFARQIKKCEGACEGLVTPTEHWRQTIEAFREHDDLVWPYPGPISVRESGEESARLIFDRWFYLGAAAEPQSQFLESQSSQLLTLDDYRIVLSYLKHQAAESDITLLEV